MRVTPAVKAFHFGYQSGMSGRGRRAGILRQGKLGGTDRRATPT